MAGKAEDFLDSAEGFLDAPDTQPVRSRTDNFLDSDDLNDDAFFGTSGPAKRDPAYLHYPKALGRGAMQTAGGIGAYIERKGVERLAGPAPVQTPSRDVQEAAADTDFASGENPFTAAMESVSERTDKSVDQMVEESDVAQTRAARKAWDDKLAKETPEAKQRRVTIGKTLAGYGRAFSDKAQEYADDYFPADQQTQSKPFDERLSDDTTRAVLTAIIENAPNTAMSLGAAKIMGKLGKTGAYSGAAGSSYVLESGDIFQTGIKFLEQKYGGFDNVPDHEYGRLIEVSQAHGLFNAGLDALMPGNIASAAARRQLADRAIQKLMSGKSAKEIGGSTIKNAFLELAPELVQEDSAIVGESRIGIEHTPRDIANRKLQAGIAGGGIGGVTGAASAVSDIRARNAEVGTAGGEPPKAEDFLDNVEDVLSGDARQTGAPVSPESSDISGVDVLGANLDDAGPVPSQELSETTAGGAELSGDLVRTPSFLKELDDLIEVQSKDGAVRSAPQPSEAIDGFTAPPEGISKDTISHVKALRDIFGSKPFLEHGFGGLDTKTQGLVLSHMLGVRQNRKVLDAVIKFIPVDVVNILSGKKVAPNKLGHNEAMLANFLPGESYRPIAVSADVPSSQISSVAPFGTKKIPRQAGSSGQGPVDTGATRDTIDGRHDATPNSGVGLGTGGAQTPPVPSILPKPTRESNRGPRTLAEEKLALRERSRQAGVSPASAETAKATQEVATPQPAAPTSQDRSARQDRPETRRQDTVQRKSVAQMSPDELRRELLTDSLTGLPNRRAYGEADKKPVQVAIDLDSLKWINDEMGHESGDKALEALGQALRESGLEAYHISGDEFMVQGDDRAAIEAGMTGIRSRLDNAVIHFEHPDGSTTTKTGVHFSYGIGATRNEADTALSIDKANREASGRRAARGQAPGGVERRAKAQPDNQDRSAANQEVTPPEQPPDSRTPRAGTEPPSKEGVSLSASEKTETKPDPSPQADMFAPMVEAAKAMTEAANAFKIVFEKNPEARTASPVAESQAPATPEPGERSVASTQEGGAPGPVADEVAKSGEVSPVDEAAHEAATSPQNDIPQPTEAQKDAGNYAKGHVTIGGLDIAIENPAGSKRRPEWPDLKSHYGYFKRTEGKDGDQVDVFVKPGTPDDYSGPVFVVDQTNKDGKFDEHKVLIGWNDGAAARAGYLENYTPGWTGLGAMRKFSLGEFKLWLKSGNTKKPVALQGKKLTSASKTFDDYIADREARAKSFGRNKIMEETRNALAGMTLGREFGESVESFYARRPDLKTKADAYQAFLNGEQASSASDSSVDKSIADAESNGIVLSDADKSEIREAFAESGKLNAEANRIALRGSDPMGKGNAFPMGVGYTKMTKRKEQAIDRSVRMAGESTKITEKARNYEKRARAMLRGEGTESDLARKADIKAKSKRKLIEMLIGWKPGTNISTFTVERVNKDRDGYPASYTISGDGIVKGVMDKVNVVKDFFGGDVDEFRSIVDEVRTEKEKDVTTPGVEPVKASVKALTPELGLKLNGLYKVAENAQQAIRKFDPKPGPSGEYVHVSRAKATTRNARADMAAELWQQKRKEFGKALRDAAQQGYEIPQKYIDLAGSAFEYDENGKYAPVNQKQDDEVHSDRADTTPEPASKTEAHEAIFKRVNDGDITVDEFKKVFEDVVANEKTITAELSKLTKNELLDRFGSYRMSRYRNDKKDRIVSAVYDDMLMDFNLGKSYSFGYGGGSYKESMTKAIRKNVEATTSEELAAYAEKVKASRAERQKRAESMVEAVKDPKTLEDFETFLRVKKRTDLTQEQRERYDELRADKSRSERATRKTQERTTVQAAGATTGAEIIATKHTRDGYDLFVVKPAERVERDVYNAWNMAAKKLGGWYSSFRGNGAIPGFQFKTREAAEAFQKYVSGGDTDAVQEQAKARRDAFADDRSQTAVERLREMADKLEERADESLNQDRKTNTARRARMAAGAEASAEHQKSMAKTMLNLAQAIEDGKAKFLDRVRQKVQVEMLNGFVNSARYAELRAKYKDYIDQEKHKYDKPTAETVEHADWPTYTAYRSDLARLGRELLGVDGLKLIGQRILKVADDVSDAYTKFAKENLFKVSRFATKDGGRPVFPTKDDAETAIARSGYKGKATSIQMKRGQHMIVMSPAEAQREGIWKGDDDKRITISPELGAEIMEKADRRGWGRRFSNLHQFESAHEQRKRFATMGIETPAEFRSALREFIKYREEQKAPDKVKEMERAMIGKRKDGLDFFPTPSDTADRMVQVADIKEGMTVLEPSAGMGHIADRIREAGFDTDVIELSGDRRELLEAKGYNVVGSDFMDMTLENTPDGTGYDRIVMNPPFSDRRDMQHVQHAYSLLRPGGRLVAIVGEGVFFGSDRKATEFREWLESIGGTDEKLEEGTFKDASLPVNTGANARMVVIDKAKESDNDAPQFSRESGDATIADRNGISLPNGIDANLKEKAAALEEAAQDAGAFKITSARLLDAVLKDSAGKITADLKAVKILQDLFGAPVAFITATSKFKFHGVYHNGTIWLNPDSPLSLPLVFGHELSHRMKADNPSDYRALLKAVSPMLRNVDAYEEKNNLYGMKDNLIAEEMLGDVMGDRFGEPEFWQQVAANTNRSEFHKIIDVIRLWIGRAIARLRGLGKDGGLGSKDFIGDLEAARKIIAKAVAEYAQTRKAGLSASNEPQFSRDTTPATDDSAKSEREQTPAEGRLRQAMRASANAGLKIARPIAKAAATTNKVLDVVTAAPFKLARTEKWLPQSVDWLLDQGARLVPEKVKAGTVSDYGLTEKHTDRRTQVTVGERKLLRRTMTVLDRIAGLNRAESSVAYQWMQEKPDTAREQALLGKLPTESRNFLKELKQQITEMGKEAVKLGMLSQESFDRNNMSYLHRTYASHEFQDKSVQKQRSRAIKVMSDAWKGRGIRDDVNVERLDHVEQGKKYVRMDLRGDDGKRKRSAYIPEGEPIPAQYSSWKRDGVWEARWIGGGDKVGMWRDLTPEERQRLGELDEIRFAVLKTVHEMARDIEVAKFLEWVADNESRDSEDGIDPEHIKNASESLASAYKKDDWVLVPETTIPRSGGTKVYGRLAGKYVPGPVWNDIRQAVKSSYKPWGETYAFLMKAFKVSKTALSPVVHTNNVFANFLMADWHDVDAKDMHEAAWVLVNRESGAEAKELWERFEDSGATIGMFAHHEIKREQLAPLLDQLRKEIQGLDETDAKLRLASILSDVIHGRAADAVAAIKQGKSYAIGEKVVNFQIDLYQREDEFFRLATFLKGIREGKPDLQAGKDARKSFLDYDINAPWIQAARHTVFPFISFPYRALPMFIDIAKNKPWKLAKLMLVASLLNAFGYMMSGGDEDDERAFLPDEKAGKIWGIVPKLIRMPWNDENEDPVLLDVRRWVPLGDFFDVGATNSALPLSPVMIPGGPLAVVAELISNRSNFTDKDITKDTDFWYEQAGDVASHLYKAMAPNAIWVPGSYASAKLWTAMGGADGESATDAFGREYSVPQALFSSFGIKVASYPTDNLKRNAIFEYQADKAEINRVISQASSQRERNLIDQEQYENTVAKQVEKLKRLNERFALKSEKKND